ncbi:hypothetical protein NJC08_04125 [Pseudomonas fluorescens]|uniref:hypothetical protein n=1 Tax=Pseudomonas TaxID=286 RepID=UPI000BA3DD59|nr:MULTISPECIES: hypothetical protein [Pseudomonas]MCO7625594.1 hypothetical protein [Pseudomonas fluorescens]
MRHFIISLLSLTASSLALSDEKNADQARLMLKNYGLSHCILKPFKENSALEKDIGLSAIAD